MSALLLAVLALGVALLALAYSYTAYTTARDAECMRVHFDPLPIPYLSTAKALSAEEAEALRDGWNASAPLKTAYGPLESGTLRCDRPYRHFAHSWPLPTSQWRCDGGAE